MRTIYTIAFIIPNLKLELNSDKKLKTFFTENKVNDKNGDFFILLLVKHKRNKIINVS